MKNKKVIKIKVEPYKQILQTSIRYKKLIEKEENLQNDIIKNFIEKTEGFFNRFGEIRKNLSEEKRKILNALTKEIKEKKIQSLKGIREYNRKEKIKKQNEKREKTYVKEGLVDNEESAKRATELLQNSILTKLMRVNKLDSSQLLDIADEDVDIDDINSVIDYILRTYKENTPAEIMEEIPEDSDFQLFNDYKKAVEHNVTFILREDFFNKFVFYMNSKGINFYDLSATDLEEEYQNYLEGQYDGIL